jgi:hypothetical protein
VVAGALLGLNGQASAIAVGTPAWFAWLEEAITFAFASEQGSFTARKERSGRSGWYWKAYRKRDGALHRAYLGKAADLTIDRLNAIASGLVSRSVERLAVESTTAIGAARGAPGVSLHADPIVPLPTGIVTFLFTDIEGSSHLWELHPQLMPAALTRSSQPLSTVEQQVVRSTARKIACASYCNAYYQAPAASVLVFLLFTNSYIPPYCEGKSYKHSLLICMGGNRNIGSGAPVAMRSATTSQQRSFRAKSLPFIS